MLDNLKNTLNLPLTDFPMRANLVQREPNRFKYWESNNLYNAIQEKNKLKDQKVFLLHDGPPFTNGDVHIGTAANKVLKDIILRYKSMQGFITPYIPGWDCHGLPIEHKVSIDLTKEKHILNPLIIRKKCKEFSQKYINIQTEQFKRLGILAEWNKAYKTIDSQYEADVLRTFAAFVDHNLVYRSKKPVYWSIPCKTALAEFEIEYQEHVSDSIWVKFKLQDSYKIGYSIPIYFIIWTTTPWTIPSNLAIAVNSKINYQVLIINESEGFIIAEKLLDEFIKTCNITNFKKGLIFQGKNLENLIAIHPFIKRNSLIINADYVNIESGTGCVHVAPGHGLDDYISGIKYGLNPYSPIDDEGKYVKDEYMPKSLIGINILDHNNECPANKEIIKLLTNNHSIIYQNKVNHSYPYCWRSKTPVIYRALDQWFISLHKSNFRNKALEAIEEVTWISAWNKKRIIGSISNRPDWCISRQRYWGVPIPCFYDENKNPVLDSNIILEIAKKIEKYGSDIWFSASEEELLKGINLPQEIKNKKLKKGIDTLDVWIESGSSHQAIIRKDSNLPWPVDIYFEGSDQHRGWFQSSLLTGIITENAAPFKTVITHGFIVDKERKKISKSDKKSKKADDYINLYGADILRLWISSEDYKSDITFSDDILQNVIQSYRIIRNTLRFQIGNLYDFNNETDSIDIKELTYIDKWILHKTSILIEEIISYYDKYEFHRAYQIINKFCSIILSANYHDILKDRLYTYCAKSKERRSAQTAIYKVFNILVRILAPIITFTSDEAYSFFTVKNEYNKKIIHLEDFPKVNQNWKNFELAKDLEELFQLKSFVNEKIESLRKQKIIGQSLDSKIIFNFYNKNNLYNLVKFYIKDLPEFFIVSEVQFYYKKSSLAKNNVDIEVLHADGIRCPRSWRWVPSLVRVDGFNESVCKRCAKVLSSK